ncbi:MAG TPA: efflux RND transporter periplasmic adaptor subunit [Casimicrobiaceae bacterium]|nr:efflux RND transporter periplasmic adaptor subunit [Casimicrobiaceae bacterium]
MPSLIVVHPPLRMLAQASAISLVLGLAACGKPENKPAEKPPVDVTVVTVARKDTPVTGTYVAQTQSSQAVNIQARVSGFLDKRVYVEGSVVKAGQVLFRMDQKPFQAQVDAAKAALQRNQAALEVAKANLGRTKPLAEQNALSQKDLDDATGQFQQASAAVEQTKAQLEEAELNLSYTTITSPVTGVSSFAAVADGTYLSPQNSQLTTVSVLTPMWINFSVSENQMGRIRDEIQRGLLRMPAAGEFTVEIELVTGSLFPYTGRITFANPSYNAQTGTFLIRATVQNPSGTLRPNQYVRVRLKGATRPNAVVVPQRAVQQGGKGQFVWVVNKDDQAELRPVTVGDWEADGWFIDDGLDNGDRIVVEGGQRLAQGVKVKAAPYAATPAAAATAANTVAQQGSGSERSSPGAERSSPGSEKSSPGGTHADAAVYFATGSAALDETAKGVIRMKAAEIMGVGNAITITGYADKTGRSSNNVELASQRALAVKDALVQLGVHTDRVRLEKPANVTGGDNDDEARRVDMKVSQ